MARKPPAAPLVAVLLLTLVGAITARWTWVHAQVAAAEVGRAAAAVESANPPSPGTVLAAEQHLRAARRELDSVRPVAAGTATMAGALEWLPGVGQLARQASATWTLADAGTKLGHELALAGRIALGRLDGVEAGGAAAASERRLEHYVVQQGDTLFRIASARGGTVETLMALNGIVDRGRMSLSSGQVLLVPPTELPRSEPAPRAPAAASASAALLAAAPDLARHLAAANRSFSRAGEARERLGNPDGPFDALRPLLERWDTAAPRLAQALPEAERLARVLPLAVGGTQPVTYLVLVQTSDEQRATGGFITSVGSVRLEAGRIVGLGFQKVYAAEGIEAQGPERGAEQASAPPPEPLSRYMGLGQWLLRDANWWADFPTTARQAATFWEASQGERVDGVIALNEAVLEAVLGAVGPVELSGGRSVSAANLKEVTLAAVYRGEGPAQWNVAQTAYSQELGRALALAIERLPGERLLDLAAALGATAVRRDLLISAFERPVAEALRELGLDGALGGARDDYVYLVEHNVSYNKLSPFIRRDLAYTVELGPDARPKSARLTVDLANTYAPERGLPGYPPGYYYGLRWNEFTRKLDGGVGFYGDYLRLYTPLSSRFGRVDGFDEGPAIETESNRTVVGGYIVVEMGAERRLQYDWTPSGQPSQPGRYRLQVQRQPGARPHSLTVRIVLPPDTRPSAVAPAGAAVEGNSLTWRTTLEQDVVVEVSL